MTEPKGPQEPFVEPTLRVYEVVWGSESSSGAPYDGSHYRVVAIGFVKLSAKKRDPRKESVFYFKSDFKANISAFSFGDTPPEAQERSRR